jgi:hypothetical protein
MAGKVQRIETSSHKRSLVMRATPIVLSSAMLLSRLRVSYRTFGRHPVAQAPLDSLHYECSMGNESC